MSLLHTGGGVVVMKGEARWMHIWRCQNYIYQGILFCKSPEIPCVCVCVCVCVCYKHILVLGGGSRMMRITHVFIFRILWKTRIDSSRMRTARSWPYGGGLCLRGVSGGGVFVQGGLCPGGLCPRGPLSRGRLCPRGVSVLGGLPDRDPPPPWTEWQTGVKILPCPKLRLRAINMHWRTQGLLGHPLSVQFLSFSCILPNNGFLPKTLGLAFPRLGNSGSITAVCKWY